jgi:hypothetical protein
MKKLIVLSVVVGVAAWLVGATTLTGQTPAPAAGPPDPLGLADAPEIPVLQAFAIPVRPLGGDKEDRGFPVNVLQDCWTTTFEEFDVDPEAEMYIIPSQQLVFVWKHKIMEFCTNYRARGFIFPCQMDKAAIKRRDLVAQWQIELGPVEPGFEYIFGVYIPGLPPGQFDWLLLTECNDTNGTITPGLDGDIDDVCGANMGVQYKLIFGFEPAQVVDIDPGGFPPGRRPGENGETRPWCFDLTP